MSTLPATIRHALIGVPELARADLTQVQGTLLGGVTNESWGVIVDGQGLVIRVPRPGTPSLLDRNAEAHNTRRMSELGVNVPTTFFDPATGVKVCPWLDGRPLTAKELRDPIVLVEICRLLRRVHESGLDLRPAFSPARMLEHIEDLHGLLPAPIAEIEQDFQRCRDRLLSFKAPLVPCHQDLYRANFLRVRARLFLIDWEHSGLGDPMYDLADLSVQGELSPAEDRALLEAYVSVRSDSETTKRFFWAKQLSRLVWGSWAILRAEVSGGDTAHLDAGRRKLQAARKALLTPVT